MRRGLAPDAASSAETPVFMRVRRTAPKSTFNLPKSFVNGNLPVFSGNLLVFVDFH
jgi:hypothetical protein